MSNKSFMHMKLLPIIFFVSIRITSFSQDLVEIESNKIESKVITWYQDFHKNPELSNREFRTSKIVEAHLRQLGLEVKTGIAHTGVVGILRGSEKGPIIAIRADMDALPVVEQTNLSYSSKVKAIYEGKEVGVMHACGHDAHVACLMGAAEILTKMKNQLKGTILFIFQPAEEGAPSGEQGGAELMVKEGVFKEMQPEAVFALHTDGRFDVGTLAVRPNGMLAASDELEIWVNGKQTHGAFPWDGVDPIVVASQIVLGLQLIPSRQLNMSIAPSLVTIGSINGGVRGNIIPNKVHMIGTIRTFDTEIQQEFHDRIRHTVHKISEASNATAEVQITKQAPVTYNDPDLLAQMAPSLKKSVGESNLLVPPVEMGAEDFPFLVQNSKGLYFYLGVRSIGKEIAPQHSPNYYVDESALSIGVKTLSNLAIDYLKQN
jgi:amidohydrolase